MKRRELMQELARTRARLYALEEAAGLAKAPPFAPRLDGFGHDVQVRYLREGRVYEGRVWL